MKMIRAVLVPVAFAVSLTALGLPTRACIGDQVDSIHFHSGQPDFGTLPRRAVMWNEEDVRPLHEGFHDVWNANLVRKQEMTAEHQDKTEQAREQQESEIRDEARAAVLRGQWKRAAHFYALIDAAKAHRGDLRDRIELLTFAAQARQPLSAPRRRAIALYIRAMDLGVSSAKEDGGQEEREAHALFKNLADGESPPFLRPFAQYQVACLDAEEGNVAAAIEEYNTLARNNPNGPKSEAALLMLGRTTILSNSIAESDLPCLPAGVKALRTLLTRYPHTRFRAAAKGLLARVDFFKGHPQAAIDTYFSVDDLASVEIIAATLPHGPQRDAITPRLFAAYLRRLNRASTYSVYTRTVTDIRKTLIVLTPQGAKAFVAQLHHEPTLAAPYFYYRLYHCDNKQRDLANLAGLARRLAGHSGGNLPPVVQVRLAEVFYQQGDYADALRWSAVLLNGTKSADRALYVLGASLHHLKRYHEALADFDRLLGHYPTSPLRFAAREEHALLCEATGDLGGALDDYFALDYQPDIAFFLDVRMTTRQVAAYLAAHPRHPKHDLLVYSLGVRHLRDENYAAARRLLTSLSPARYVAFGKPDDDQGYRQWDDTDGPHPLRAVRDLSALQDAIDHAAGPNARADALFQYASYYYKHGTLLLYNGALWRGTREANFDFWWNARHATRDDDAATREHMYAHEIYARAQKVCLEIVRRYPRSPAAPPALYRAACCADKLAGFNGWWRDDNAHHDHTMEAANLMRQFVRRYPHHALAPEARKFARVWNEEAFAALADRKAHPNN